jgi:hypothetical protein
VQTMRSLSNRISAPMPTVVLELGERRECGSRARNKHGSRLKASKIKARTRTTADPDWLTFPGLKQTEAQRRTAQAKA